MVTVKPTIFVVEDDPDISRLVRHHLEGANFNVRLYATGNIVVSDAERQRPSLFLLDIMVPGKDGLDAGHQFAWAERLRDVVIGAQFQSENAIGLAAFRGQKDYRDRRQLDRLPDLAAKLQAIFSGHHDIEQKQRWPLALRVGHDHVARRIQTHVEAGAFQMMAHEAGNIGIVFHYKDRWFHGLHCSWEM